MNSNENAVFEEVDSKAAGLALLSNGVEGVFYKVVSGKSQLALRSDFYNQVKSSGFGRWVDAFPSKYRHPNVVFFDFPVPVQDLVGHLSGRGARVLPKVFLQESSDEPAYFLIFAYRMLGMKDNEVKQMCENFFCSEQKQWTIVELMVICNNIDYAEPIRLTALLAWIAPELAKIYLPNFRFNHLHTFKLCKEDIENLPFHRLVLARFIASLLEAYRTEEFDDKWKDCKNALAETALDLYKLVPDLFLLSAVGLGRKKVFLTTMGMRWGFLQRYLYSIHVGDASKHAGLLQNFIAYVSRTDFGSPVLKETYNAIGLI